MMPPRFRFLAARAGGAIAAAAATPLVVAMLSAACSSSGAEGQPPPPRSEASAEASADDASRDAGHDGTDLDGDAHVDGPSLFDASAEGEAGSPVYEAGATVCNPTMVVSSPAVLAASTNLDDRFGAVTSDELTVAWVVPSGPDAVVRFADRASVADAFSATQALTDLTALDEVALSPDGLRLVAIAADRRGFLLFERAARGDTFTAASPELFDALVAALSVDERLGDPVLAFGEQVLVYSVYGGASTATVRFATRLSSGSPWSVGGALDFPELRAQGNLRRRPTGVGDDFQTLFYWDEVDSTEKLGHMKGTIGFWGVHGLGANRYAQPNGPCTRIYYTAPGGAGLDLWSAQVD